MLDLIFATACIPLALHSFLNMPRIVIFQTGADDFSRTPFCHPAYDNLNHEVKFGYLYRLEQSDYFERD